MSVLHCSLAPENRSVPAYYGTEHVLSSPSMLFRDFLWVKDPSNVKDTAPEA